MTAIVYLQFPNTLQLCVFVGRFRGCRLTSVHVAHSLVDTRAILARNEYVCVCVCVGVPGSCFEKRVLISDWNFRNRDVASVSAHERSTAQFHNLKLRALFVFFHQSWKTYA